MTKYGIILSIAAVSVLLGFVSAAAADTKSQGIPTSLVVRVVGSHGMPLGDSVGGAAVTIRDVATGAVLASGKQTGPSGDLRAIMQTPRLPTEHTYSATDSAAYTVDLVLRKPTLLEVVGEGPLNFPAAKRRASK